MTVTSLLMSIFREECRMIRVKTDEHGILEGCKANKETVNSYAISYF